MTDTTDTPTPADPDAPLYPTAYVDGLRPRERKLIGNYWSSWSDDQRRSFLSKLDSDAPVDFDGLADIAGVDEETAATTTPDPDDGTGTGGIDGVQDKGTSDPASGGQDTPPTPVTDPGARPVTSSEGGDPADIDEALATVDSALAFAEANPERTGELLAAERAGKNRVTLVAALED